MALPCEEQKSNQTTVVKKNKNKRSYSESLILLDYLLLSLPFRGIQGVMALPKFQSLQYIFHVDHYNFLISLLQEKKITAVLLFLT